MSRWTTLSSARASTCWGESADANPTISQDWFVALEESGSVAREQGWLPCHLQNTDNDWVVPLYAKAHSSGEYVFDQGWAKAAQRAGLSYYPKLVTAVPYIPTRGRRLLGVAQDDLNRAANEALNTVKVVAQHNQMSSWHVLFPEEFELEAWHSTGMLHRLGCQYHWFDRGYGDFETYLSHFRSSRRSDVLRERRLVAEQGIQIQVLEGTVLEPFHWDVMEQCYRSTYQKLSGHEGYLTPAFFRQVAQTMADRIVMFMAFQAGKPVAAMLCLRSQDTLYGRSWGALGEFANLHFELCYYQGIEYCLRQGLTRFDGGAQGEHKVARGFEPVLTHSFHWLAHPGLSQAVDDFLLSERDHIRAYAVQAHKLLPFHRGKLTPDFGA